MSWARSRARSSSRSRKRRKEASARALGHAIFTEADDLAALRDAVRDAVRCHFDEEERPRVIRLHLVREEVFAA
jgi:hypothetical protein